MLHPRRLLPLSVLAVSVFAIGFAQKREDASQAKVGNPNLRLQLIAMKEQDQKIRNELISKMATRPIDSADIARQNAIDDANTRRLKEIIHENGWPGKTLVGLDGAEAAFLIAQHSSDTLFQRSCLPLLQNAFKASEASGQDFALLTDRVLVREGKAQIYGSQASLVNGKLVLAPIEDQVNVDKRRADLGLPPMSEYLMLLREVYQLKDK